MAVGAGLLPAILFGGVIGAGMGATLLYLGELRSRTGPPCNAYTSSLSPRAPPVPISSEQHQQRQ